VSGLDSVSVLVVPGLRDGTPEHWQALLAAELPEVRSLPALGRRNIDLRARMDAIETAVIAATRPVVIVAHSGGCIATVHWARSTTQQVRGMLLAVPPDLDRELPAEFPPRQAFADAGWLPIPTEPLPFACIVAASRNDPLADFDTVADMARAWGAELADVGRVGHLNPASGYGPWGEAAVLVRRLAEGSTASPASPRAARAASRITAARS
jgi:predicted alpha/beta hydrolase family esterase